MIRATQEQIELVEKVLRRNLPRTEQEEFIFFHDDLVAFDAVISTLRHERDEAQRRLDTGPTPPKVYMAYWKNVNCKSCEPDEAWITALAKYPENAKLLVMDQCGYFKIKPTVEEIEVVEYIRQPGL